MARSSDRISSLFQQYEQPPEDGWDRNRGIANMSRMISRLIHRKEVTFKKGTIRDLAKIKAVQPNGEMVTMGVLLHNPIRKSPTAASCRPPQSGYSAKQHWKIGWDIAI